MDITQILSWTNSSSINYIELMQAKSFTRTLEEFSFQTSRLPSLQISRELLSNFSSLSEKQLRRVFTAPETYFRLTTESKNFSFNYFNSIFFAEEPKCIPKDYSCNVLWTALGDKNLSRLNSFSDWNISYLAPKVNNIVIDSYSPTSFRRSDGSAISDIESCNFSSLEKDLLVKSFSDHMTTVLQEINKINTLTHDFILSLIKVIVLQFDNKFNNFSTISGRAFLGQVIFRNVPKNIDHPEITMDSIIHEAIHALLYHVEQKKPWMKNIYSNDFLESPWTGNKIRVDSFLHACFVWYGLTKYWKFALESDYGNIESAKKMYLRAIKGFQSSNLINQLNKHRNNIEVDVLELISSLPNNLI